MTIRRDQTTRHGAIQRAFEEVGGIAMAAEITGKTTRRLYDATNPTAKGRHAGDISFHDACNLTGRGAHALVEHLAMIAGSRMVAVPEAPVAASMIAAQSRFGLQFAQAFASVSAALDDGVITKNERRKVAADVLQAIQSATSLLAQLQSEG